MRWRKRTTVAQRPDPDAARRRLAEERRRLEEMQAETTKYAELGQRLRHGRARNHISEGLTALYRGGQS